MKCKIRKKEYCNFAIMLNANAMFECSIIKICEKCPIKKSQKKIK